MTPPEEAGACAASEPRPSERILFILLNHVLLLLLFQYALPDGTSVPLLTHSPCFLPLLFTVLNAKDSAQTKH